MKDEFERRFDCESDGHSVHLSKIAETYAAAFERHGNSSSAILDPKGRQKERFESILSAVQGEPFSILDFGCGLGHLVPHLREKYEDFEYTGVDIVEAFIDEDRRRFPKEKFLKIKSIADVTESYDYVVIAGAFNLRYSENPAENTRLVYAMLAHLFQRTRIALAANFMTDDVDYVQEGAYHQNVEDLYRFARQNLSRRLVVDQSFLPYEFSIVLHADHEIMRPDNIYR